MLVSPVLAALILLAFPACFEPQGSFYKGVPYRILSTKVFGQAKDTGGGEALLPGGRAVFPSMREFTSAIDGAPEASSSPSDNQAAKGNN
jgi:hypothetical protein